VLSRGVAEREYLMQVTAAMTTTIHTTALPTREWFTDMRHSPVKKPAGFYHITTVWVGAAIFPGIVVNAGTIMGTPSSSSALSGQTTNSPHLLVTPAGSRLEACTTTSTAMM
jgi:hypothetical protein